MENVNEDFLTVSQLAKSLNLTKSLIYLRIHQKRLAYYKDKKTNKVFVKMSDWQKLKELDLERVENQK